MRIATRLTFAAWFLLAASALAGPLEGEMFGYRLGAKYPVTAQTQGYFMVLGQAVLVAEKGHSPLELPRVEIIATPKTFTIANIYASAEFASEAPAKELEARYADLLGSLYGGKCQKTKAYLNEALKLHCSGKYELSVHRFTPDKPDEKHKVHVGLKFANESAPGKRILAQFESELAELEERGRLERLDKARNQGQLKGLK